MVDDGRGMVLFVHDAGNHADSWGPWIAVFDSNGYDAIALRWPGEPPTAHPGGAAPPQTSGRTGRADRPGRRRGAIDGQAPILVGHGVGGLVAHGLLGRCDLAAVIVLGPTRRKRPAPPGHGRWVVPIGARGRVPRSPAVASNDVPVLLVTGGRSARMAERIRRRRRGQLAAVTDRVRVADHDAALVYGARWHVTADLCLDWLTSQNQ